MEIELKNIEVYIPYTCVIIKNSYPIEFEKILYKNNSVYLFDKKDFITLSDDDAIIYNGLLILYFKKETEKLVGKFIIKNNKLYIYEK